MIFRLRTTDDQKRPQEPLQLVLENIPSLDSALLASTLVLLLQHFGYPLESSRVTHLVDKGDLRIPIRVWIMRKRSRSELDLLETTRQTA